MYVSDAPNHAELFSPKYILEFRQLYYEDDSDNVVLTGGESVASTRGHVVAAAPVPQKARKTEGA